MENQENQNEKLRALIDEKKFAELRRMLETMEPADIAAFLSDLPEEELPLVFRLLPKELAASTFVELDTDGEELLLRSFSDIEMREVMDQLFADDTVDIIEEMPANVVSRMLRIIPAEQRRTINELLNYPDDSAGSVMTVEYIELRPTMTVEDAFACIRRTGLDKETVYTCYVTDANRHLIGLVTALTLMLTEHNALIGDIMETNVISAGTLEPKEEVAHQIERYDLLALPVVDKENRLVGIVTVDDAIDVISDETEDEFTKMAAIAPMEDSYFKTSVFKHAKKRIVWLLILMISATISGAVITHYQEAFSSVPILVAFLPMLMDTGGNCGSQSSTMIIRGLATEEIRMRDYLRVLRKEISIGAIVGLLMASVNFVRVMIQYHNSSMAPQLGLTLGITLISTAIIAKTLGCTMPMLAKKLKLDPAIMASPLITTMVDCFTVLVYFNIALLILPI